MASTPDMIEKPATAQAPKEEVPIYVMPEEFHGAPAGKSHEPVAPVVPPPVVPPPVTVVAPPKPAPVAPKAGGAKGALPLTKKPWFLPGAVGAGVVVLAGVAFGAYYFTRPPQIAVVQSVCGNTQCEVGEDVVSCSLDCSPPIACGDGACQVGEDATLCPADCAPAPVCGNAVCEAGEEGGEIGGSCPADCVSIPTPPVQGVDSDSDGLTDVEETGIYGSNAQDADTDRDTFVDLNEVLNLFDPIVVAPGALENNPGITVYTNLDFGFSLFAPRAWTVAADTVTREVVFSAASGDKVVVLGLDKPAEQSLKDWYVQNYSATDFSAASAEVQTTKLGYSFIMAPDRMHSWILLGDKLYGVRYESNGAPTVEYNVTYDMMLMSMRVSK